MQTKLLTDAEVSQLREILASARNIVVCCHKSPDGDAIGSSLAWAEFLSGREPSVESGEPRVSVVVPDAPPAFLQWMPGFQRIVRYDKRPDDVKTLIDGADLVCCLDFNTTSRTEEMQSLLDDCTPPKLLIDHHLSPDIDAVMSISRPEASSTCELVFCLIWQLGGYATMTTDCATNIYCGLMTDTGAFAYNSSRPEVFYIAAKLLEKGISKDLIYRRVYHNYSLNAVRLRSYVISHNMQVVEQLHAAYFTITRSDMKRFRFVRGDAEGLVNVPLTVKGMKLSISLREDTEKDNLVLVSLRSSNGFHCERMAREWFNGGGHEDAAGGKLYGSIEEAEQIALKAIMAFQYQLGGSKNI